MKAAAKKLKQRLRLDVGREICRQYPLFCFLLLFLSAASLLLNRYRWRCGASGGRRKGLGRRGLLGLLRGPEMRPGASGVPPAPSSSFYRCVH